MLTALARLRSESAPAHLAIGSPWISDAPLFPGVFAGSFSFLLPGIEPSDVATIGSFMRCWKANGGDASLLVQNYDPSDHPTKTGAFYNKLELALLRQCLDADIEVLLGRGFHDKFVIVPDVVISGSANMTYSGLYVNRERLTLHTQLSAPHDFKTAELVCQNHLVTARGFGICRPPGIPAGLVDSVSLEGLSKCYSGSWK